MRINWGKVGAFFTAPVSFKSIVASVAGAMLVTTLLARADTNYLGTVFLSDPTTPSRQMTVNADGSINTSGTVSITNPTVGGAVPATANYVAGNQGGLLTGITLTAGNVNVNCASGCSGGSFNNNADAQATSATNGQTAAWLYAWNGASFDRLVNGNGTSAKALRVTLSSDSTGQVAFAAGSTTAVTQATAASLNATVVGNVTPADAAALGTTSIRSYAQGGVYNGTTVDLSREAANGTNSTGTGVPIGALAGNFDDVTPVACTENQFCNLRMGSAGALHVELWQSNGANALAFGGPADGGSNSINTAIFQAWGVIYNGTTWDRMREVANSANTVGTGILASGLMGQCDDTTPTALTENSFGNLRMDCTDHSQTMGGIATTAAPSYSTATARALSLTTAGALRVDGSAVTQPVSITGNQAVNEAQINGVTVLMGNGVTGTGSQRVTISSDNTSNSNPWLVNGAVTPADAKALGTTSVGTYSYTGIYNGTTIDLLREATNSLNSTGVGLPTAQVVGQCDDTTPTALTENSFGNAAIDCVNHGQIVSALVTTGAPSYSTATSRGLSLNTSGGLRVDGSGVTQPVSGTVTAAQATASSLNATVVGTGTFVDQATLQTQTDTVMVGGVNIKEINAVAPLMGNGVTGTGSLRVTLASDTTSNSNAFLVNGNVTPADAKALGTTSIGTYSYMGVYNGTTVDLAREAANSTNSTGTGITAAAQVGQCDDVSPTAITENSFGNARIDCASHAQLVTIVPSLSAGGTTLFTLTLANTTNATNVKAGPGQVYSISGFNMSSATPVWISLYDNVGTPTCGTNIKQQFLIPGSTTGAGFVYDFATPKSFPTGIAFCATTGIAGTVAPAATTYVLNVDYK